MSRNPNLDIYYDCLGVAPYPNEVYNQGVVTFGFVLEGDFTSRSVLASPIEFQFIIGGSFPRPVKIFGDIDFDTVHLLGTFSFLSSKSNWVFWSTIGELNFNPTRSNLAGHMPMQWAGSVFKILKLGNGIVVYGSGGITQMVPKGEAWSPKMLMWQSLLSPTSIFGNDLVHLFITKDGTLWQLAEQGLDKLGYSEFLSELVDPVISYDSESYLAYICDGTNGYVYNTDLKSLGTGPNNITGIGHYDGQSFPIASGEIVNPLLELTTNLFDGNTRNFKTLLSIEAGVTCETSIQTMMSASSNNTVETVDSVWSLLTHEGISYNRMFGKDFKISLKTLEPQKAQIDYIRIKGVIHDYSPTDV